MEHILARQRKAKKLEPRAKVNQKPKANQKPKLEPEAKVKVNQNQGLLPQGTQTYALACHSDYGNTCVLRARDKGVALKEDTLMGLNGKNPYLCLH